MCFATSFLVPPSTSQSLYGPSPSASHLRSTQRTSRSRLSIAPPFSSPLAFQSAGADLAVKNAIQTTPKCRGEKRGGFCSGFFGGFFWCVLCRENPHQKFTAFFTVIFTCVFRCDFWGASLNFHCVFHCNFTAFFSAIFILPEPMGARDRLPEAPIEALTC